MSTAFPRPCGACGRAIYIGEIIRSSGETGKAKLTKFTCCDHCYTTARAFSLHDTSKSHLPSSTAFEQWKPLTITELRYFVYWRSGWRRLDGTLYPTPRRRTDSWL